MTLYDTLTNIVGHIYLAMKAKQKVTVSSPVMSDAAQVLNLFRRIKRDYPTVYLEVEPHVRKYCGEVSRYVKQKQQDASLKNEYAAFDSAAKGTSVDDCLADYRQKVARSGAVKHSALREIQKSQRYLDDYVSSLATAQEPTSHKVATLLGTMYDMLKKKARSYLR